MPGGVAAKWESPPILCATIPVPIASPVHGPRRGRSSRLGGGSGFGPGIPARLGHFAAQAESDFIGLFLSVPQTEESV